MSLCYFDGPAGSGKTTRLMKEVAFVLKAQPLNEYQKVLALTKIHGSRRRLHHRLLKIPELNRRFECMTADSYARRLLGRWCSLARLRFGNVPDIDDHDEFCNLAGNLIADDVVSQWVTITYPIVVVDEMQDSKGGQLRMLQELTKSAICLAAADDFQDLEADGENEAVSWAIENGEVMSLLQIHRTDVEGLLDAASAIREGREVRNGLGFEIISVPKPQFGAWYVSKHIKKWRRDGTLAIITPTAPDKSPFVRDLIARVESGPIGQKWKYGPFSVPWELSHQAAFTEFMDKLGLPGNPDEKVSIGQLNLDASHGPSSALASWLDRKRRISAKEEFSVAEICAQIDLIQQRIRAFGHSWDQRFCAMTIHQAKNREFDSVIFLWPFQVQGSEERHRRLLYNAITRAKKQTLIVVQDPKNNRLRQSPFTPVF